MTYHPKSDFIAVMMERGFLADCTDYQGLDEAFAAGTMFKGRIAHGMLTGGVISAALAMVLPGPGAIYLGQSLRFRKPVRIGDELTVQLRVTAKRDDRKFVTLNCEVINQDGTIVVDGTAEVMAPTEKIIIDLPPEPRVTIEA